MALGKGILWKGKYFSRPQAASSIDSSNLASVQLGSDNKVALLAQCVGLIPPKTALKVSNPSQALQLIHPESEEARLAVQLLFSPSPGRAGASEVTIVPVNPSVRGSLTLDSKLTLTSFMYGAMANQIKAIVEAGTGAVGKKVSIQYANNEAEVFDLLTKESFSIVYTGSGSACTMTINVAAATHLLTSSCTGATSDNLSVDLNTYNTIQKLADYISATGKYTFTIITPTPSDSSLHLDNVTGQSIATSYTAKSDLQAIINGINKLSGYVVASRVTDAAAVPANMTAWSYLTSGSDGSTTNNDWQAGFDLLKTMDIDIVVPLSTSSSIHAMGDTHCVLMSGPSGKSERRQFVGGALNSWADEASRLTSLAALKTAARALNSDRTVLAGLGSYHYDANGTSKLYAAHITACMYAGIAAGASPAMPLTRKYLACLGLEVELRLDSEDGDLIEAGVAVPIPDTVQGAGYVISRQVTTWSQDVDPYRIEYSVGRVADYVATQVRARHELLIGQPGTEQMDATIKNITNAVLEACLRDGYIRSYDPKLTQIRADGMTRYVDYSAVPVQPVSWIMSTYHLMPTSFVL